MLRQIGNTLPMPYKFRPAVDLATEVEWAKNRRLTPETYRRGLNGHEPPIPDDLMARVFREYERRKEASGALDFEDLLGLAIKLLEDEPRRSRSCTTAITPLRSTSTRTSTCCSRRCSSSGSATATSSVRVGDDYQSIYALHGRDSRVPAGAAAALPERDRRSARGQLPLDATGARSCQPARPAARRRREAAARDAWAGPRAELRGFDSGDAEAQFVVERVRELHAAARPSRRWPC